MPRHSIVSLRLITKEKTDGSFACDLASRFALYSLSDFGGSQRMKRAIAGVMHSNTSSASAILNGLSCSLADRIKTCMLALPNILVSGRGRSVENIFSPAWQSIHLRPAILHSLKSIPLDAFARWWLLEDDPETSFGNLSFENRRRF